MKRTRNLDIAFIAVFALVLTAPVAGKAFNIYVPWTVAENRRMAGSPKIQLAFSAIRKFPTQFDAYFTDNFRFRNVLIRLNSLLKVRILGTSPSQSVVLGKDGWLYFAGEDKSIYRKKHEYSEEELREREQEFSADVDNFKKSNMRFYMMIVPEKQSIYDEYLPLYLKDLNRHSRYLQFLGSMENTSYRASIVDIYRDLIREKKKGRLLYYKTDSHWNDLAAMVAYKRLIQAIQRDCDLARNATSAKCAVQVKTYSGDLAQMLGLQEIISENSYFLPNATRKTDTERYRRSYEGVEIEHELIASPSQACPEGGVVMIRDSQARPMIPWIASSFCRCVFVDALETDETISKIISKERPAIVIYERAERAWELDLERFAGMNTDIWHYQSLKTSSP
jgi:alginate O-acetyltransferase complex protein AlgJ